MSQLLWNIILALLWVSLQGQFRPSQLILGFAVGYLVLLVCRPVLPESSYTRKVWQVFSLLGHLLRDILLTNLQLAWRILKPNMDIHPAVIAVPLRARSDVEIVMLANLITLTPGTLSIDISPDHSTLFVHVLDLRNAEGFRGEIRQGLERRILEVLR